MADVSEQSSRKVLDGGLRVLVDQDGLGRGRRPSECSASCMSAGTGNRTSGGESGPVGASARTRQGWQECAREGEESKPPPGQDFLAPTHGPLGQSHLTSRPSRRSATGYLQPKCVRILAAPIGSGHHLYVRATCGLGRRFNGRGCVLAAEGF